MTQAKSRTTPEEAQEILGIGKSQYYAKLKRLGIKARKEDGKAYLDEEQMRRLTEDEEPGELAIAASGSLSLELPKELPEELIPEDDEADAEELNVLMREAAELKAQQIAMPDLLKLYLAAGMNEEDLPEDLRLKIQAARDAANPKQSAATIADQLLQRYRQNQQSKNPNR